MNVHDIMSRGRLAAGCHFCWPRQSSFLLVTLTHIAEVFDGEAVDATQL
jgi:hypothetical protein